MAEKPQPKKAGKKKDGEKELTDPRQIAYKLAEKDIALLPPPPEKPDEAKFKTARDEITTEIDAIKTKLQTIGDYIQSKIGGKDEASLHKESLYQAKKALQIEISEILEKKKGNKDARDVLYNQGESTSKEFQNLQKEVTVSSLEDLEKRVKEIEHKMHYSSLNLKEEKKCMVEIAQLKKMKPKFEQIAKKKQEMEEAKGKKQDGIESLKKDNQSLQEQVSSKFEERAKIEAEIDALKAKDEDKRKALDSEFTSRNELRTKRDELVAKRKELQDVHFSAMDARREYDNKVWAIRKEKEREQWAIVDAKQKQEALAVKKEKAKENPFLKDMTLLEQTIAYLKGLVPAEEKEAQEEKDKAEKKDLSGDAPKGMVVMANKKQRDEQFYWAPTKGAKNKKKTGNKQSKTIKHNPRTFDMFAELKCDAPMNTSDVTPTLEKLQARYSEFENKVKEWQQKQEEEIMREAEGGAAADEAEEEEKEE